MIATPHTDARDLAQADGLASSPLLFVLGARIIAEFSDTLQADRGSADFIGYV